MPAALSTEDLAQHILSLLPQDGTPVLNRVMRVMLSRELERPIDPKAFFAARDLLFGKGKIGRLRGQGGQLFLTQKSSRAQVGEEEDEELDPVLPADMDTRVKELCAALAEAERGGHAFIALKWFRDSFLPRKSFRWNQNPESRQAILAEAIQRGVVLTSKIANPKTPAYPTTTIRLNRAEAGIPEEAQRFHPVAVNGESLTAVLEEERGVL